MRSFIEDIKNRVLVYDGSKGYMLQQMGLKANECGELWNVEKPDAVRRVYLAYKEAGSDIIQTNTFPGNRIHLDKFGLGDRTYELNYHGTRLAKKAVGEDCLVAASIGPTGLLFEPLGELTFRIAYEIFKEQVKAVVDGGADIINFETFTDVAEMRAALLAAKETVDLPVICSMAYETNGRTLMGSDPETAAAVLMSLGADLIGVNCSMGAEHMLGIVKALHEAGAGFVSVKPNAGLPEVVDEKVIYKETADRFADAALEFAQYGARLIGGCCGTTPEYIHAVKDRLTGFIPVFPKNRPKRLITSTLKSLQIFDDMAINSCRLDAGTDPALAKGLTAGSVDEVKDAVLELSTKGYDAVCINVDAAGGDNTLLEITVTAAQGYIREPLIIETVRPVALEKALRIYKGAAGVVLDGMEEGVRERAMAAVRKYGSVVIGR